MVTLDTVSGVALYQIRGAEGEVLREWEVTTGGGEVSYRHLKDFVYGSDGLLATVARSGSRRYFHKDHLGSPRAITNDGGQTIGESDYFPFGEEVAGGAPYDEPTVKFTGHQRDLHGFSDYMLGRSYLFPLRRFASVDPARDGWNLYAYVGNNPVARIDPTGLLQQGVDPRNPFEDEITVTAEAPLRTAQAERDQVAAIREGFGSIRAIHTATEANTTLSFEGRNFNADAVQRMKATGEQGDASRALESVVGGVSLLLLGAPAGGLIPKPALVAGGTAGAQGFIDAMQDGQVTPAEGGGILFTSALAGTVGSKLPPKSPVLIQIAVGLAANAASKTVQKTLDKKKQP